MDYEHKAYLNVAYENKELCKKFGGRFDYENKKWYIAIRNRYETKKAIENYEKQFNNYLALIALGLEGTDIKLTYNKKEEIKFLLDSF